MDDHVDDPQLDEGKKEYEKQMESIHYEMFLNSRKKNGIVRSKQFPKLTPWSEFKKIAFPAAQWLINGILPQQGLAIIASPSGEKKTWIALHAADCIASGKDFLGHSEFKVQQGNVLYLDQEMSRAELQRRGKLLGISDKIVIPSELDQLNFQTPEDMDWLFAQVKEYAFKAIFIDTFRAVAGGLLEDKAEEIRTFMSKFLPLKTMGVCVIFLDHCRKPNQREGKVPTKDQLLGSQDKLASVEVLLMIKSDARSDEIAVYPRKNRTGIEQKPFRIEMKDEVDEKLQPIGVISMKYAGDEEDKEYKVDQARNAVMDILSNGGKKRQELLQIIFDTERIGNKNTSDSIRKLEKEGLITSKKVGKENFYELNLNPVSEESDTFAELFDSN